MHIGIRVRKARDDLGISREELVQRMPESLRMDRNTLWHIEAGRTKNPRADQLLALAHVLSVSVDYLLGLTDDPTPAMQRRRRRPTADSELLPTALAWIGA